MNGWDGVRAWRFIRASDGYRKAWQRHNPPLGLPEPAPFPVRLQTGVDLAALEWGMFAWEDPYAERPIGPFWVRARMSDGMVRPDGLPLAALAAEGGAALAGLRVGDGSLILKIERKGAAAQVRIPGGGAFPADGGLLLVREVARIEDVWSGVPSITFRRPATLLAFRVLDLLGLRFTFLSVNVLGSRPCVGSPADYMSRTIRCGVASHASANRRRPVHIPKDVDNGSAPARSSPRGKGVKSHLWRCVMQPYTRNFLLTCIFAFVMTALVQAAWSAERPPVPSNYRSLIAEQLKSFFTDPYSLRDVAIASPQWEGPVPGYTDHRPAWLVCFRANSKNAQGGYDGIRTYIFAIRDGEVFWYFWAPVGASGAAGALAPSGDLGGYMRSLRAQGWAEDAISWHVADLLWAVFVHAYCRNDDWRLWPEVEGR